MGCCCHNRGYAVSRNIYYISSYVNFIAGVGPAGPGGQYGRARYAGLSWGRLSWLSGILWAPGRDGKDILGIGAGFEGVEAGVQEMDIYSV